MSRIPIKDRMISAIRANGGRMKYYALARAVFPDDQYPHAFSGPARGGPPGCYMVLSRAIREHGFHMAFDPDPKSRVVHSTIYIGKAIGGEA